MKEVLSQLKMNANEFLRKNESEFKTFDEVKNLREEVIIDLMVEIPKLIEIPIVIWDSKVVVSRPFGILTDLLLK